MIPKGYQIHIKTWENDFDSIKNTVSSGLTREDVSYLMELASYFEKKDQKNQISNKGIKPNALFDILKACQIKHPDVSKKLKKDLFVDDLDLELSEEEFHGLMRDYYYRLLCDWVLSNAEEENYRYSEKYDIFCRVVFKIKVFYFPEDGEDVTSSFKS